MAVTLSQTTLSSAIDAAASRITLAATTGIVKDTTLVCNAEFMRVTSLVENVPNAVQVIRGWDGTAAVPHTAAAVVRYGPRKYFLYFDRSGACLPANEGALPSINPMTGNYFDNDSGVWAWTVRGGAKAGTAAPMMASAEALADEEKRAGGERLGPDGEVLPSHPTQPIAEPRPKR